MSNVTIFTWKIENFSCLKDGCLQSPTFESHSKQLMISICPADKKGYVAVKLKTLESTSKFTLDCAVAILDSEGSPLFWSEKKKCCIGYHYSREYDIDFQIRDSYFNNKIRIRNKKVKEITGIKKDDECGSMKLLENDILIIECHMWITDNPRLESEKFFARTRIEPNPIKKTKKFVLNVNRASSVSSYYTLKHVELMEGTRSDGNFLTFELNLNQQETFVVNIMPPLFYRIQANFKVSLLEVSGKIVPFANVDFVFNEKQKEESFCTNITKRMIMSYRNRFVSSNEIISLVFECTLLYVINFNRLISENEYTAYTANNPQPIALGRNIPEINPITARNPQPTVLDHNIPKITPKAVKPEIQPINNPDTSNNVNRALKNIFEEGFLSDFSLRVQDRTFPVHKAILGARSSIFRAMFTTDMKEKESSCVDISDVDADTIQRMLKFVYCDSVEENMQWESTSSLYAAADIYALEPLKLKCSDILKSGLSVQSVLGVLAIADTHHDQDLKAAALDFILKNDKKIIGTELWSKFAEEHNQLVFEAIHKLYIKKMDKQ